MISDNTLNQIRERISIVELVGEYVQLKKSGTGFTGLCPFHNEKTPSFHVHPMKQIFHCFGCQKGGNIFGFLVELEGLRFPEAVERLAKRAGITLEKTEQRAKAARPAVKDEDKLFAANEMATKYFEYLLERPENRYALDYLKRRGLSERTIKKFRLGVSPKGWTNLIQALGRKGFSFSDLLAASLVKQRDGGSANEGYDVFRERLMFPICNSEGNVIGFGARLMNEEPRKDGTPSPKYINSPKSPLFAKRRILYGLHENQRGIRKRGEAIIVEGYMDVIGLYEAGVDNALASMGTALTEEHCAQIKGLTRNVVTVFDPDAAGTDASKRSVHILMEAGMFARDLSLPDGQDPDEFVLAHGAEAFYQLCERAPRQVTKMLKEIASRGSLSEAETGRILGQLTPILVASRNLPDRAMLWDDISLLLKVSHAALQSLTDGATARNRGIEEAKPKPGKISLSPNRNRPAGPEPYPDALALQFYLAALNDPADFLKLPKEQWFSGIKDPCLKAWLERLHDAGRSSLGMGGFEAVLEELVNQETDPRLVSPASAVLLKQPPPKDAIKDFEAVLGMVCHRKKELEIQSVSAQVRLAQRLGDEKELLRLLAKLKELRSSRSHP